jgi:tetratricopeptide (TPR) repeat protein
MSRKILVCLAAGLTVLAGQASAAVTVLGGGNAQACSQAAIAGETEPRFEKLCTLALETEILGPTDRAGTLVNRGVFKLRRAKWEEATSDFNRAIKLRPEMGEAYVNRGAAAVGAKRYAEGLPDLNRGIELGLNEPEKAYYNRALAHEGLDDMKAAYLDYKKALEIKPDWDPPRNELTRFTVSRP